MSDLRTTTITVQTIEFDANGDTLEARVTTPILRDKCPGSPLTTTDSDGTEYLICINLGAGGHDYNARPIIESD